MDTSEPPLPKQKPRVGLGLCTLLDELDHYLGGGGDLVLESDVIELLLFRKLSGELLLLEDDEDDEDD